MKRLLPLLPAALLAWLWLDAGRPVSVTAVSGFLDARVRGLEKVLRDGRGRLIARSSRLAARDPADRLDETQLRPREALFTVENGVVRASTGEIAFFRRSEIRPGDLQLVRKGHLVFALRRISGTLYYQAPFLDLEDPRLLHGLRIGDAAVALQFSARTAARPAPGFEADPVSNRYFVRRVLDGSCGQLMLDMTISRQDVEKAYRRRHDGWIDLLLVALAAALLGAARGTRARWPAGLLAGAALLLALWRAVTRLAAVNMGWKLVATLPPLQRVQHAFLLLLAAGVLLLLRSRRRRGSGYGWAFAAFNATAVIAAGLAPALLRHVDFPYADFALRPGYLGLLGSLLLLHLLPLLAGFAALPEKGPAGRPGGGWAVAQAALLALAVTVRVPGWEIWILLSACFAPLPLARDRLWPRLLAGLAAALSVTALLLAGDAAEKRGFIRDSLSPIFSSQSHYAKLVAREIIGVINGRQGGPYGFFTDAGVDLEEIWRNSLAARENIASGIFVLAPDGGMRGEFHYQMPYIPVPPRTNERFPFWHVQEVPAVLFGRTVSMAVATIHVFAEGRLLGSIVVEVLNSPELILKNRDQTTIFTLNRRIRGEQLSYLRLDEEGRVMENPANLSAAGFRLLPQAGDRWVSFRDGGARYAGYAFRQQEQTVVIFYPVHSPIRVVALFVRAFLAALVLLALGHLRVLRRLDWKFLYRSFSVKVFLILVLVSLSTALLFSLFALNANLSAQQGLARATAFERGRVAQNIVRNLAAERGEITPNHLFLLAGILDGDVSVYENGVLLHASNYRQVIRLQLPEFLHSGVRRLLEQANQPFALEERLDGGANLYFRVPPAYVVRVDMAGGRAGAGQSGREHVDFTISLLFALLVVGLAAARFFRNLILAPIHELNRGMSGVERGQLEPLPDLPTETELKSLYAGFNAMVEGLREQRRSISEIARMKTMIQLGRRVAHEVKNPLTPIRLSAEQIPLLLDERETNPQWRQQVIQAVRFITEETEHLRRVAYGFLDLSKLDEMSPEPFALGEMAAQELESLRPIYTGVRLQMRAGGEDVAVSADRTKIKQALRNLVGNAIEAVTPGQGMVEVAVRSEGGWAVLEVRDNGRGMSPDELALIERENYTLKEAGSGLGLSIVRRIVELHHGRLAIDSQPGQGTIVTLRLVRHDAQG